jgi:hypothetical protein
MKFPTTPSLTAPVAPVRIEADAADLEVGGAVPRDLDTKKYAFEKLSSPR